LQIGSASAANFATPTGWAILEDYVRYEQAISGAALAGREALNTLLAVAKSKPRHFDRIRKFHGVGVYFVSQGIDTLNKERPPIGYHQRHDGRAMRRRQEGRVLQGLNPGGRCYGYINVPIEDRACFRRVHGWQPAN